MLIGRFTSAIPRPTNLPNSPLGRRSCEPIILEIKRYPSSPQRAIVTPSSVFMYWMRGSTATLFYVITRILAAAELAVSTLTTLSVSTF